MAASLGSLLFVSFLYFISHPSHGFRPKALVLPVSKDASTLQYTTLISQRTPLVPVKLVLDLGGQFLWVDCDQNYVSSTYHPARCHSAKCSLARSTGCGDCFSTPRPGCYNNTCGLDPDNTITHTATGGQLGYDVVSVRSTDGSNPGRVVAVSDFLFVCAPTVLLEGLASGATGMAGLGRARIGLPSQFASAFSFHKKFAICLTSSRSDGVVFFGDGPYNFLGVPIVDASKLLTYTALYINSVSTATAFSQGEPSTEYFIGVKSIRIGDNKTVPLNSSLLSIDSDGYGGVKISTVDPYTVMEASIFAAFTEAFVEELAAMNVSRVAAAKPFEVCFSTENVLSTRVGPSVPFINLVLQNDSVTWTITGSNSMVQVSDEVLCLGFVNGGSNPRTSIVIGAYQFEDNLLQIDLARSRLGFTGTLFWERTTCSNFNFTSTA